MRLGTWSRSHATTATTVPRFAGIPSVVPCSVPSLDAAFFHLYGLGRDDVDYVMDTFWVVRDRDVKTHREYRTKRLILEIYDDLAEAIATGRQYQTRLDPPPADTRLAHAEATAGIPSD